ncbi:hypothetical protein SSX86_014155 [Deinandra increscens subsp. villosa]|uniref:Uncharacterized protein n=1 Tax=Deinandra increscens subsp. villosa TaxID=3103831 RepID=A0AAP0D5W5_9ASTR
MGCRPSKVDDLPLVIRCRERKRLIKSAVDYRYDLSSSHLAYFHSLKEIGNALSRFVDEQLVIPSPPPSSSPVLTLPSDLGKTKNNNNNNNGSMSSGSISHVHIIDDGEHDFDSDSESTSSLDGHIHVHDDDDDDDDGGGGGGGGFKNKPPSASDFNQPHGYKIDSDEPYVINNRGPQAFQETNQVNWGDNPYEINRGPVAYQPPWGGGDPYVVNPSLSAFQYQPPWGSNQTGWGEGEGEGDPYVMNPSASQFQPPWGAYQENFNSYNGYGGNPYSNPYSNSNQYVSYMKKSAPASRTVIQQGETRGFQERSEWVDPQHYDPYGSAYGYGFSYGGATGRQLPEEPKKPKSPPPPPPPPAAPVSDYFSFFDTYDNEYGGGYGYGYESMCSSPDSNEVREREGIPELEEETETESHIEEVMKMKSFNTKRNLDEGKEDLEGSSWTGPSSSTGGSSRRIPPGQGEGTAKAAHVENTSNSVPFENNKGAHSVSTEVDKHSSETIVSQRMEEAYEGKKGVHFDMDEESTQELESSIFSSLTTLSPHGSRDLHEVVNEIKDEFEVAFSYGREVALMLEAGKLPYQSKFAVLKVILSKILSPLAPSLASSDHPVQSARPYSQVTKLAGSYNVDEVQDVRPINLSSTLERLYVWEKKLYKEVKGEERLRVIYENMCKRLNELDAKGAESTKIDAAQASIRRLLTKLNVSIKAIDTISCEIQKVRDKELQPQVSELIYGLIRMWQAIVTCHRKQFEAIMESRSRSLRATTSLERDSNLRTTLELEAGLVTWAQHFNNWINAQKSYVDSLNGWLKQCVDHKPEVTIDGEIPYSPGRLGAPPIFIMCNDWHREIKDVSQERVSKAMRNFALNLRQLLERQDDMQRLMLKKEYLAKDFVKKSQHMGPDKTHGSMVPSEDRASLDYIEAMKLVGNGGSSSLQGGVIPIFKALESFTCDALKAHEQTGYWPDSISGFGYGFSKD